MATVPRTPLGREYPTSDGRPMAETDWHRDLMTTLIAILKMWYANIRRVYVSGNLLLYYVPGNKRKHVSPDVFVVRGVSKQKRLYYLLWEEGKSPEMIIELTSKSTRKEDLNTKYALYQDVLKVLEYFLFDPFAEYLDPPLRGYRLSDGKYLPIEPVGGRLPSEVLRLHLERDGMMLRFYDPATRKWLPTPEESLAQAQAERNEETARRLRAETELEALRQQLDVLQKRLKD
jgi:Uma2 family endonuclease